MVLVFNSNRNKTGASLVRVTVTVQVVCTLFSSGYSEETTRAHVHTHTGKDPTNKKVIVVHLFNCA